MLLVWDKRYDANKENPTLTVRHFQNNTQNTEGIPCERSQRFFTSHKVVQHAESARQLVWSVTLRSRR